MRQAAELNCPSFALHLTFSPPSECPMSLPSVDVPKLTCSALYRAAFILLYRTFLPHAWPVRLKATPEIAHEASETCTRMSEELHHMFLLYHKTFSSRNMTYTTLWSMVSTFLAGYETRLSCSTLRRRSTRSTSNRRTPRLARRPARDWSSLYMCWNEEACNAQESKG